MDIRIVFSSFMKKKLVEFYENFVESVDFFNNIVTFTVFLNIGNLSSSIFNFFLQYFKDFITEVFYLLF